MVALASIAIFTLITTIIPVAIFADTVSFDGDLTAANTYFRSNYYDPGSNYYSYFAKALVPDTDGVYSIEVVAVNPEDMDTTMFLYEDCFDKDDPTNNLVAVDDDSGAGWCSKIDWSMTAGRKYIVVISTSMYSDPLGHVDCEATGSGAVAVSDNVECFLPADVEEEPVWIRTMPMTCWQVWKNEDNMFEFIFWYPYKDNNWVRIYDMEGNMVYEVDVPLEDPHIVVDLPDGMYTVKTFWLDPEKPNQEFLIGKP